MKHIEAFLEWGGLKKDIFCLSVSAVALIVSIFGLVPLPFDAAWAAIVLCGVPIILEAVVGLVTAFDIKADVLVSLALIASVATGETFAAGEVAFIMQLGALLEDLTVERARSGIERLVRLTPRTARLLTAEGERVVGAEEVREGDILRVLPGETIPVDGVVTAGETSVDQSVMTGESLPVDKSAGDEVSSGTVNRFGSFDMRATRVGEDSSIQRMVRLVQSADAGKAKIVGLADRWATWIVVIALSAAAVTWLVTSEVIRAVTILVVFCPCALVLATPTAIMAAIGNATKHGFLVREGDALERLAGVKYYAFDKTGTLTTGRLHIAGVEALGDAGPEELLALAAGAEARSEHPLGRAIAAGYKETSGAAAAEPEEFRMLPGKGVSARVAGREVLAGSAALLSEHGIDAAGAAAAAQRYAAEGCTAVYVAVDGALAGLIALSDTMRPEAAEMASALREGGAEPVLLTGDNESAARAIASAAGIRDYRAGCLPEDKLRFIDEAEAAGRPVCMTGDGINDAPALRRATVGIAMGGVGSDIAMDAADIVLVGDELRELPHLQRLAKRMMLTIKCNLTFSMALNFVAIILAMTAVIDPVIGALVHNSGSVIVILNSALLLRYAPSRPR